MTTKNETAATKPWWKYPMVWFVLSGPIIVVFAGITTVYIAASDPNKVVDVNYYQNGLKLSEPGARIDRSMMPAMDARNHVSTPTEALEQSE